MCAHEVYRRPCPEWTGPCMPSRKCVNGYAQGQWLGLGLGLGWMSCLFVDAMKEGGETWANIGSAIGQHKNACKAR